MANLVTVTKDARILLKVGGAVFGTFLLVYMIFTGYTMMQQLFFPKPPPPPAQAHGKLPHIVFPSSGEPGIEFTINTIDGQLPELPDRVNIYKLIKPEPNLLALQTTKNTLDSKNFIENQIKRSDTLYQWSQSRTGIVIEYDIVTKNFVITSSYLANPSLLSTSLMPDDKSIISDLKSYLQTIKAYTENIDFENSKVEYLELQGGSLVPAQNLGTARLARVTLIPNKVDELQIDSGAPENSHLNFIVSYPSGSLEILDGMFVNHQIDIEEKSDYPIKTSQQALEDLKAGNAYVINPNDLKKVDLTTVELKYFQTRNSNGFLLPVIVFTGVDFIGYVEALPSTSLSN